MWFRFSLSQYYLCLEIKLSLTIKDWFANFMKIRKKCSVKLSKSIANRVSRTVRTLPPSDGVTIKMLYGIDIYIDQLCIPSFRIGLVKTESGFIVRSVETGLGRWTLVVVVIGVDSYPILAFSDLTCYLEDTEIGVFWMHCAA